MNNLPTLNRQGRSLTAQGLAGLGFARHPMVSRSGNRFTLVDAAGNTRPIALMDATGRIYLDMIIFDNSPHPNRMFFLDAYEPDTQQPPDCFSDNGEGPSTQSRNPQSATCATCPQAVWGSKISPQGKEIPACQTGKKLAVLILDDPSGVAYEFRVPPGSFSRQPELDPQEGGWTWFLKTLKAHGAEPFDVVTRVTFVPNTMGILVFKPVAMVEGNTVLIERINAAWAGEVSSDLLGLGDKPIDPQQFIARQGRPAGAMPGAQKPEANYPPPPAVAPPLPAGIWPGVIPPASPQSWPTAGAAALPAPTAPAPRPRKPRAAPAETATQVDSGIPPFLQRAPGPASPPPSGIAPPQPADAGMLAQLAKAFSLPLGNKS
jgi:hypothetical protein